MAKIDTLFRMLKEKDASDLHMLESQPPKLRIHGELHPVEDHPKLSEPMLREYLQEITSPEQWERYEAHGDLDFAHSLEGEARFRCNYLKQVFGRGAVFRIIPEDIKTVTDLGLPEAVAKLAHLRSGLVLVTGPTGSGKSTSLAAIINEINVTYKKHIITIEDPIEFVHQNKKSVLTQREVGQDSDSFASALKAAMREDPDVILVGEMRDLETISLALTAAELGLLVFGTLHTNNAAKTIDRVIDVFPAGRQPMVRTMLAESLQAVISQLLLRRSDKPGRIPAMEVLLRREGMSNMIREGAVTKIVSMMEMGKGQGMQLMDNAILDLLKQRIISGDEAYQKALNKQMFQQFRDGEGIGEIELELEDDD